MNTPQLWRMCTIFIIAATILPIATVHASAQDFNHNYPRLSPLPYHPPPGPKYFPPVPYHPRPSNQPPGWLPPRTPPIYPGHPPLEYPGQYFIPERPDTYRPHPPPIYRGRDDLYPVNPPNRHPPADPTHLYPVKPPRRECPWCPPPGR